MGIIYDPDQMVFLGILDLALHTADLFDLDRAVFRFQSPQPRMIAAAEFQAFRAAAAACPVSAEDLMGEAHGRCFLADTPIPVEEIGVRHRAGGSGALQCPDRHSLLYDFS
jgi:hypothetical protein